MARRRTLQRVPNPASADNPAEEESQVEEEAEEGSEEDEQDVHAGQEGAEPEPQADPLRDLSDTSQVASEVGFRLPIYYTQAVDRIIMDCPKGDAVSARERDVLKSAYNAIREVAGNPDDILFETFLRTQEGAENFPMTFRMMARDSNGEMPWVGVIDINETPTSEH